MKYDERRECIMIMQITCIFYLNNTRQNSQIDHYNLMSLPLNNNIYAESFIQIPRKGRIDTANIIHDSIKLNFY